MTSEGKGRVMQQEISLGMFFAILLGQATAAVEPQKILLPVRGQRLTAYLAEPEGSGPFPAVLFLHGGRGGIVGGDPERLAAELARAGYVALSPMRLQRGTLREELQQTAIALSSLRGMDQVDRDRVAVVGFSRGGLLALMAAVHSADLRAAVLMAPASGRGALERALGMATKQTPPTLILVAKNDTRQADHVALARQAERRLRQAGSPVQLVLYPPFGGFSADGHRLFFEVRTSYWKDVLAFLGRHLGDSDTD